MKEVKETKQGAFSFVSFIFDSVCMAKPSHTRTKTNITRNLAKKHPLGRHYSSRYISVKWAKWKISLLWL